MTLEPWICAVLTNFSGNAIRFYEFFTASEVGLAIGKSEDIACADPYCRVCCFRAQLNDAIHEAQDYGLALHVHTGQRTLSPDWVELAAFLIAANDQSSFSYSQVRFKGLLVALHLSSTPFPRRVPGCSTPSR